MRPLFLLFLKSWSNIFWYVKKPLIVSFNKPKQIFQSTHNFWRYALLNKSTRFSLCPRIANRVVGMAHAVEWPARSPDLTQLFFLCGKIQNLRKRITECIRKYPAHKDGTQRNWCNEDQGWNLYSSRRQPGRGQSSTVNSLQKNQRQTKQPFRATFYHKKINDLCCK